MKRFLTLVVVALMMVSMMVPAMADGASVQAGQSMAFGHFDQDYPQQSISWKVLAVNGDTAVLLSEQALECRMYDKASSEWSKSSLCKWLNGTFLVNAFTADERQLMTRDLDGNSVFIPTVQDMTNEAFGFFSKKDAADGSRSAKGTSHATANGLWTNKNGECSYFTRTAANSGDVYQVRTDGTIGVATVERDNVGVRVMIYVKVR